MCTVRSYRFGFVRFSMFMLLCTNNLFAETQIKPVPLQSDVFEHISFSRIKANRYTYHDQQLQIDVDGSASFLMMPFDTVRQVNKVSFEWRSDGVPHVKDSLHEKKRGGDDAVFKIGLLLKTENSLPNPFFLSWIKQVDKLLKFPSDHLVYLVPNAQHPVGEQWENPYNHRATMISVNSHAEISGWQACSYNFQQPLDVVGIWLMADGDNTNSSFTSHVKNIRIE